MKNIIYLICILLGLSTYSYAATLVPTASAALISSINITTSAELTQLTQTQLAAGTAIGSTIMTIEIDNNHIDGFTVSIADNDDGSDFNSNTNDYFLDPVTTAGVAQSAGDHIAFTLACGGGTNPPVFSTPANASDNDDSGASTDSTTVNASYDDYTFGVDLDGSSADEKKCLVIDDPQSGTIGSILAVKMIVASDKTTQFLQNTAGTIRYITTLTITIADN
jgi:hypothetical protein